MDPTYQVLIDFFREKLQHYRQEGLEVFASSSFQTHSIPMLHILSEVDRTIPIYFLQTGYHFPETITYKNQIASLLGLEVTELTSPVSKINQRDKDGQLYCCYLNKTLPMEPILGQYDVWITGVRREQNANRATMDYESRGKHGILRFHPMLDWTSKQIFQYIRDHNLPKHPLEDQGYLSIGCEPCTLKLSALMHSDRDGRWAGLNKTECGLHTDLVEKES
jgi:phosphoadenosine phosphosulfate reductase